MLLGEQEGRICLERKQMRKFECTIVHQMCTSARVFVNSPSNPEQPKVLSSVRSYPGAQDSIANRRTRMRLSFIAPVILVSLLGL